MIVSVEKFVSEIDRYLDLVGSEEIVITKDGQSVASLTRPPKNLSRKDKLAILHSLRGIVPSTVNEEDIRAERLKKHEVGL